MISLIISALLAVVPVGAPSAPETPARPAETETGVLVDVSVAELSCPSASPYVGAEPDIFVEAPTGAEAYLVQQVDGVTIPGRHWLLAAHDRSTDVRIWDATPRVPVAKYRGYPETTASNLIAHDTAEALTGVDLPLVDFTTATGGGPSGGLVWLIAYLDIASNGAYTNGISVAATGVLGRSGRLSAIANAERKLVAAGETDAEVFFTTTSVDAERTLVYFAIGNRWHPAGTPVSVERQWDRYQQWGAMVGGSELMPVVYVRHIGDVTAYLCGAGSAYACALGAGLDTFEFVPDGTRTERGVAAQLDAIAAEQAELRRLGVR